MKKLITLSTVILLMTACQKQSTKVISKEVQKETIADANNSQSVTTTSVIDCGIKSYSYVGNVETVIFTNGATGVFTPDAVDHGLWHIVLSYQNLRITNLTGKVTVAGGIQTVKLMYNGVVFHSCQINSSNQIGNLFVDENIYPYTVFNPNGRISYAACMHGMFVGCGHSWSCSIICGAAIVSCSMGWSLTCVAISIQSFNIRLLPAENYRTAYHWKLRELSFAGWVM